MNHVCELPQDLDPELQVGKYVQLSKLESAFRQKLVLREKLAEFKVGAHLSTTSSFGTDRTRFFQAHSAPRAYLFLGTTP